MAQSFRNSLKRQSLCCGSQSCVARTLPWLALAGEGDGEELLDVPALAADGTVKWNSHHAASASLSLMLAEHLSALILCRLSILHILLAAFFFFFLNNRVAYSLQHFFVFLHLRLVKIKQLQGHNSPVKPENLRGALTVGSAGGAISCPVVFSLACTFFFGLALTLAIRSTKQDGQCLFIQIKIQMQTCLIFSIKRARTQKPRDSFQTFQLIPSLFYCVKRLCATSKVSDIFQLLSHFESEIMFLKKRRKKFVSYLKHVCL